MKPKKFVWVIFRVGDVHERSEEVVISFVAAIARKFMQGRNADQYFQRKRSLLLTVRNRAVRPT